MPKGHKLISKIQITAAETDKITKEQQRKRRGGT
jgi:hypothetical protein